MCGPNSGHTHADPNTFEIEIDHETGIVKIITGRFDAAIHGRAEDLIKFLRREGLIDDTAKVEIVHSVSHATAQAAARQSIGGKGGGWRK